ncbi:ABC transporter substrate-binding protein [Acetobacterium woodii]|uniref:ABC transport system substrate-binding protein n=1 Tax=Acetobacterium woodii (strain ATCC 29683 / DSM 1030 / JCM 2381 / KCTC 1655 / WB1) TaxID=931626 RepID=H6LKT0_ACEWD|nr:ABC transporter substrate-binding protein [Acetobacterium woodii]AFA50039.1 ABC transport system substrate-binding protein [Acetobacterium woodii DSM 1030]
MNYFENNVMALMPCAVKVPMEAKIAGFIKDKQLSLKYEILSNAVVQDNIFEDIKTITDLEALPDVMVAPGFSRFFFPSFVERFTKKGAFQSSLDFAVSDAYKDSGVIDPNAYYDIIAVNPLIFLVDQTNYPDLAPPQTWADLLSPQYEQKIAFRGHTAEVLCEGVLFEIYRSHGLEGIKKLARNIKSRLHPAQMVALAGSKKKEAPFISVIPLSFANLVKENDQIRVIWPEDGAVMNPVVMLTKKDCCEDAKQVSRYLISTAVGDLFSEVGFCSLRPELEAKMPRSGKYKWISWDFLLQTDVEKLHDELNQVVNTYSLERA